MMITMMIRVVFLKVGLQFTFLGQAGLKCTHYDRPRYIKYEDDDDDDYAYHDDDHDDHKHDDHFLIA